MRTKAPGLPSWVQKNIKLFDNFILESHSVVMKLLEYLSTGMGLIGPARSQDSHRAGIPARTTLVLFRYPHQPDLGAGIGKIMHTDI